MLKKITTYFLSFCVLITPVFLTGCIDTDTESENSVYNTFSGMKISYMSDFSGDLTVEQKSYLQDVEYEIDAMAEDIIINLISEYGVGVNDLGAGTLTVESDNTETYTGADSVAVSYNIIPLAKKTTFEPFNAGAIEDTETHYDAIQTDNGTGWNWKIADTNSVTIGPLDVSYYNRFSLEHEENLKIAIAMILAGYEVYDTASADYTMFTDTAISFTQLVKEIDHLGLTSDDADNINSFILNVVIGESLISADSSRFYDADGNGYFDAEEYINLDGSTNLDGTTPTYTSDLTGVAEKYDDTTGATPDSYDDGEYYEDLDGSTTYTLDLVGVAEKYNDLNSSDGFDEIDGFEEYRYDYFMNYVNTVDVIIDNIYNNVNYPQILAVEFMDVNFKNYVPSETSDFPDTIAREYNSIIFQNTTATEIGWIYFMLESDYNFELEVYANYYDGSNFYSELTNTVQVTAGSYDNVNCEFEVDFESATFTGGNPLSLASAFVNNTSVTSASALYKNHGDLGEFSTQETVDGSALTAKYNDTGTTFCEIYFNIVPSAENLLDDVTFKFSVLAMDY